MWCTPHHMSSLVFYRGFSPCFSLKKTCRTEYFYKYLYINIIKTWGVIDEPNFKGSKNPSTNLFRTQLGEGPPPPLGSVKGRTCLLWAHPQGKNPSFTGHNCILDPILPAPIRCIKVFQGLTIFSSALIYVYKIFYPCNTIRAILHFGNSFS